MLWQNCLNLKWCLCSEEDGEHSHIDSEAETSSHLQEDDSLVCDHTSDGDENEQQLLGQQSNVELDSGDVQQTDRSRVPAEDVVASTSQCIDHNVSHNHLLAQKLYDEADIAYGEQSDRPSVTTDDLIAAYLTPYWWVFVTELAAVLLPTWLRVSCTEHY